MTKPSGLLNHSARSQKVSEHYHAKVIGEPRPSNQSGLNARKTRDEYHSTRPGLTAQGGLGG